MDQFRHVPIPPLKTSYSTFMDHIFQSKEEILTMSGVLNLF